MAVIRGRQVTGGNGGNPQAKKDGYPLDMEGFWLSDKFRIRAVKRTNAPACLTDLMFKMGARVSYQPRRWRVAPPFPWPPLSGGAGLEFIGHRPSQNFRTKGMVCSKSANKNRF